MNRIVWKEKFASPLKNISALAAWSARETYRVHLNDLGERSAASVDKASYDALRRQSVAG